jgi:Flp pilus assembly protein TadD
MSNALTKYCSLWICLVLTLATIAVFWQVCTYDFINYDDPAYVSQNPNIQAGITLKTIKWAFTVNYDHIWHPLTWLSNMLAWQLFGPNAGGHHLINLVFHIVNTLLLFIVLKQMIGAIWPSAFVAALFALHPLHVESVAWVTERKDVLSIFFWFLTMWAYVRFVRRPRVARYLLVIVFLALGLMSKPMLVTLPFVLLLLDYWPLGRLGPKCEKAGMKYSLSYLLIEKVPLFAIVLASCMVTFFPLKKGGIVHSEGNYDLLIRLANIPISYVRYIIKMIWPVRLAIFYPHPGQNVSILYAVVSAVLLLIVTILILRFAKDRRYLLTGWLWYLGTLVPVIGIVQAGDQAMADRYSYVTLTGLFIIIAWGLPELLGKWPHRKIVLWMSSLVVLFSLAICAYLQQRYWKDSMTIFQHALKVTKNNYLAHFCVTDMLFEQGRFEEAIWHSAEAVRIKPDYVDALNNLGATLYRVGRTDKAVGYYQRALEISPRDAKVHANLGIVLADKGEFAEAIPHYRIALETMDTSRIHTELGYALLKLGRFQEAVAEYRKVLLAMPNDPNALNDTGYALAHNGEFDEAIALYNKALQIAPDLVDIRLNLGYALTGSGKFAEAVKEYEKVLLTQPQNAVAHNDLGVVFFRQGKFDEAIAHFSQAVQISPNYTDAENNLNLALAGKQKLRSTENTKK